MKILQVAPLWETVPPKKYGGTELVVHLLCEELVKRGHEVTLFACGDSRTSAKLETCVDKPMRESNIKVPMLKELSLIAKVIDRAEEFDIIHNHLGYQMLPFINKIKAPVVTTLHGAFVVDEEVEFFNQYRDPNYISISNSQRNGAKALNYVSTVYNGIDIQRYPFKAISNTEEPYLAFLGRFSEEKGPDLAIKLAKRTGYKLIMAGKVDKADAEFFEKNVKPKIDNNQIMFIGELGHVEKCQLLKNAVATVHPVTWPEPFGLVMAESMACGTPVLALNQGSIPEVISHGETGFVEENIEDLINRVKEIDSISRQSCRKHVEENFSKEKMASGYINTYRKLINPKLSNIENVIEQFELQENT